MLRRATASCRSSAGDDRIVLMNSRQESTTVFALPTTISTYASLRQTTASALEEFNLSGRSISLFSKSKCRPSLLQTADIFLNNEQVYSVPWLLGTQQFAFMLRVNNEVLAFAVHDNRFSPKLLADQLHSNHWSKFGAAPDAVKDFSGQTRLEWANTILASM
ncbi:MAG: hypothetical protein JNL67_04345 [Planctomycetaceae bacterium]|nr:hypothetical protein [Planctomycetaceae bacterium]